jgi:putative flavoprotein involved in K+ transport
MHYTDCVVIGAGQAGLAMSRCLTDRGVDHVVLERGRVAERWRSERWDSLRLLTPNWQSRLPGFAYEGPDPDGFMTMPEVVTLFERYAASFAAPVRSGVTVTSLARGGRGFRLQTTQGPWEARAVVVATGYADRPSVPPVAARVPGGILQLAPPAYRRPSQLPEGGVLVVGASASGIQLADELSAAGREVTLAVGHHTRLPRRYRGHDILWWLDRMGVLSESADQVYDVEISREQPSLQLIGDPAFRTLDLPRLRARGVRIVGRLLDFEGDVARFADDLVATTAAADIKLASLLQRIDEFVVGQALEVEPGEPFEPACLGFAGAETSLDLRRARVGTVIWATGFRRDYGWLRVPVVDERDEIRHRGGVTPEPGLYVIGLHFLRRRNSTFIDGVGADAAELSDHLSRFLRRSRGTLMNSHVDGASPYDVIVVGARPAGAGTALLLARAGLRVLVVDRGQYGTDTLSTHALMRAGVLQLARWGVLPRVRAAGTPPVRSATFVYGGEAVTVPVKPRDGVDALYAPRRTVLDRALVDLAKDAGAEFAFGTRVTDLLRGGDRVRGVLTMDDAGRTARIPARVVVGGDGRHSMVARLAGAEFTCVGASSSANVFGYWSGLHVEGYQWYYRSSLSAGAIPTNDGRTCVFASVPTARFADVFRPDVDRGYRGVLAAVAPDLAGAMHAGLLDGPLRGFAGEPGFLRRSAGPGWALVGDAGYFKDPLTAHGITDAMVDAEYLAHAILAGGDDALAAYAVDRDRRAAVMFDVTDRIASFAWTLEEVRALHRRLSTAMADEVTALGAFSAQHESEAIA